MNISDWLIKVGEDPRPELLGAVAKAARTTEKYIRQVGNGERKGSPDWHIKLHRAAQKVTPEYPMALASMRPEVWGVLSN